MTYLEFLKANREDIIAGIEDKVMFTDVKVLDVMKELAAKECAHDLDTVIATAKRIASDFIVYGIKHDSAFEAIQDRQRRNQMAAL